MHLCLLPQNFHVHLPCPLRSFLTLDLLVFLLKKKKTVKTIALEVLSLKIA